MFLQREKRKFTIEIEDGLLIQYFETRDFQKLFFEKSEKSIFYCSFYLFVYEV